MHGNNIMIKCSKTQMAKNIQTREGVIKYQGHPYFPHPHPHQINFCRVANKGSLITKEECRFHWQLQVAGATVNEIELQLSKILQSHCQLQVSKLLSKLPSGIKFSFERCNDNSIVIITHVSNANVHRKTGNSSCMLLNMNTQYLCLFGPLLGQTDFSCLLLLSQFLAHQTVFFHEQVWRYLL